MRIGSIVIDCFEFDKMMTFWEETLHYTHNEPVEDGWVILRDPKGRGPNVSLNKVSRRPSTRNLIHFDLYTNDRNGEIERLISIGATRHSQTYEPEDDFRVLEDPDGNLFCVVQKDAVKN
ncbi:MAG: VOC family protein [Nitrososphaerales archaeon]